MSRQIHVRRLNLGMPSQADLADAMGVDPATLSRALTRGGATDNTIKAMATALQWTESKVRKCLP